MPAEDMACRKRIRTIADKLELIEKVKLTCGDALAESN